VPNDGNNRGGANQPPPPPWLIQPENNPHLSASFVEYLRWMRQPSPSDDNTSKKRDNDSKLQLLQLAEQGADYHQRLNTLTQRTRQIVRAGNGIVFNVTCPWRIRVGGHRGPENILLPAFDALGMPYIPSSTLRGVARTAAVQAITQQRLKEIQARADITLEAAKEEAAREAEKEVTRYFGALEAEHPGDRTGKVIFLDAYSLPKDSHSGGLALDMANNVWSWDDNTLNYSPNPNLFFSLKQPTFLIGILPRIRSATADEECKKVAGWLIAGLKAGAGSQINSGYGRLLLRQPEEKAVDKSRLPGEFFRLKFALDGQGIHSVQRLWNPKEPYEKNKRTGELKRNRQGQLKLNAKAEAEVRPIAFKSMLRYWFRTLALGVLAPTVVKTWEGFLFGAINPQKTYGWVKVQTVEITDEKENEEEQVGILMLAYSSEAPKDARKTIEKLFKNLTWLMFHLGGVGQGARRPCYERNDNPRIRGSSLLPKSQDEFWPLDLTMREFQGLFRQRLQAFYQALGGLSASSNTIVFDSLNDVGEVSNHQWREAVDANCEILVVSGQDSAKKPYALEVLHQYFHRLRDEQHDTDAKSLCGGEKDDEYAVNNQTFKRKAIPSPVWIADLGNYQVVTVFGATHNPRREYLKRLKSSPCKPKCLPLWPLPTTEES
jgi:CRISPR-associated protein Cmr6